MAALHAQVVMLFDFKQGKVTEDAVAIHTHATSPRPPAGASRGNLEAGVGTAESPLRSWLPLPLRPVPGAVQKARMVFEFGTVPHPISLGLDMSLDCESVCRMTLWVHMQTTES